jgi:hypothetical protein
VVRGWQQAVLCATWSSISFQERSEEHVRLALLFTLQLCVGCRPYKAGWKTIIESDTFPKGLDEDVVRAISAKKREPEWMLEFRLKAYRKWLTMAEPDWSDNR